MKEKLVEEKLFAGVRKLGGIPLKLTSPNHAGKFDRLLIMPGGSTWFVECKTTGKTLDPLQIVFEKELRKRGHKTRVVDDQKTVNELLAELKNEI